MIIRHVLQDGAEVNDIDGKVITAEAFPVLYEAVDRIKKEGVKTEDETI